MVLPLVASEHSYIVTEIIPHLPDNIPNLRMPDHSIYAKVQNKTLFLGAFEANPTSWDPVPGFSFGQFNLNMEAYMPYLEAFHKMLPMLDDVGHRSIICGPESSRACLGIFHVDAFVSLAVDFTFCAGVSCSSAAYLALLFHLGTLD